MLQCRVFAVLAARANDGFDAARVLIPEDRRRRLLAIGEAGSGLACGPQQTGAGTAPAAAPAAWGSCDCDLAELVLRSISSVPSRAKLSLVVRRSESVERVRSRIAVALGVDAAAVSLLKDGRELVGGSLADFVRCRYRATPEVMPRAELAMHINEGTGS